MSEPAAAALGHNRGPLIAPTDQQMLDDLHARFPELAAEWAKFEADLATYPQKLTLSAKDRETAAALQDLLGDMKKHISKLKAYKKDEKAPWDKAVKVIMNFFTTRQETAEEVYSVWDGVHEDFLTQVRDEKKRVAEEEAERQRQIAEAARQEAEAAERRRAEAAEREAAARRAEDEARQRAADEERRRKEAEERRIAAEAEEKRVAEEQKRRDREERQRIADNLKVARQNMKRAVSLNDALNEAAAAEKDPDEGMTSELDALVRSGGTLGSLLSPIADSPLLDEEQKALIGELRADIGAMRQALHDRLDAKEKRKRTKAAKEAEAREAEAAERRRLAREEDDRKAVEARAAREAADNEAAAARDRQKAAEADARAARGEQRDAFADQKAEGKAAAKAGQEADRADNRADRVDRKLENSTDADLSRTRGELGTVGSLRRSWKYHMPEDDSELRATCGPLGGHFTADAMSGAVFQWMRAHQASFTGERVTPKELPGVVFAYETDSQIRT